MSNIGLTSKIARSSVVFEYSLFTIIGEAVCALLIYFLCIGGVSYVFDIFKFLSAGELIIIALIHVASCALALRGSLVTLRKKVFGRAKTHLDMDFSAIEEGENV